MRPNSRSTPNRPELWAWDVISTPHPAQLASLTLFHPVPWRRANLVMKSLGMVCVRLCVAFCIKFTVRNNGVKLADEIIFGIVTAAAIPLYCARAGDAGLTRAAAAVR